MQNYSFFQRVLHDITLGNKLIKKSLYEIEKILFLKKFETKMDMDPYKYLKLSYLSLYIK